MEQQNRVHWLSWLFVILMSVALQYAVPVASDEAYFISWGRDFVPGVYDHPPMPAWISFGLWRLNDLVGFNSLEGLHRGFALFLGVASLGFLALRLHRMRLPIGPSLIAVAMVPGYILLFNLYLNDTVLTFLSLLFVLAVDNAYRAERNVWVAIVIAALAFAAMLLTKYNGAVVFLGMVLAFATWPNAWRFLFTRMFAISLMALAPFLWHLWWNYQNCSVNLAFNFDFRTSAATGFGPLWVLLTLLIMTGPLAVLVLLGLRRTLFVGFFARVFLASLVVVLAISVLRGEFGVNWGAPLGFMAVLALAEVNPRAMEIARKFGLILSFVSLVPLAALLILLKSGSLPPEAIASPREGFTVRMLYNIDEGDLVTELRGFAAGRPVAVLEYGVGASLINAGFSDVLVFSKSVYGRNQDLTTDFRAYVGQDIVLLAPTAEGETRLANELFDSAEVHRIQTDRQSYQVILGRNFRYDVYRTNWILPVLTGLYEQSRIPHGNCYMNIYY